MPRLEPVWSEFRLENQQSYKERKTAAWTEYFPFQKLPRANRAFFGGAFMAGAWKRAPCNIMEIIEIIENEIRMSVPASLQDEKLQKELVEI